MSEEQKKRLFSLALIVLGFAMLPPLLFGEARTVKDQFGGDSWRNFIFDFQTLITGIAAVSAAFITVRQMRTSEMESQKRHREILGFAIRNEVRTLTNAFDTTIKPLVFAYGELLSSVTSVLEEEGLSYEEWYEIVVSRCLPPLERVSGALKGDHFVQAEPLFDSVVLRALRTCRSSVQSLTLTMDRYKAAKVGAAQNHPMRPVNWEQFIYRLESDASSFSEELEAIPAIVEALVDELLRQQAYVDGLRRNYAIA